MEQSGSLHKRDGNLVSNDVMRSKVGVDPMDKRQSAAEDL